VCGRLNPTATAHVLQNPAGRVLLLPPQATPLPGEMMGGRMAAALLRRGRDQASAALMAPRLPTTPPAPAVPRVGSGSLGGGAGGHLPPPRLGSAASASRFASFRAFRSLAPKVRASPCAVPFPLSMARCHHPLGTAHPPVSGSFSMGTTPRRPFL
jgi:hypothetical protein